MTENQYSPELQEQVSFVSSLLHSSLCLFVEIYQLSKIKDTWLITVSMEKGLYGKILTKNEPIRMLKSTSTLAYNKLSDYKIKRFLLCDS